MREEQVKAPILQELRAMVQAKYVMAVARGKAAACKAIQVQVVVQE